MSRSDKYAIVAENKWLAADDSFKKYLKEQTKIFNKDPYFEDVIKTLSEIAGKRTAGLDREAISTDDMYEGPSKDSIIYMEDMHRNSKFDLEPLTEEEKTTALAPAEYSNYFDTSQFKTKEGEDTSTMKHLYVIVDGIKHEMIKSKSMNVCEQNKKLVDRHLNDVKETIDGYKKSLASYTKEDFEKIIKNKASNRKIIDPCTKEKMPYHLIFSEISAKYVALKSNVVKETLIFGVPVSNALIYNDKVSTEISTE